MQMTHAKYATFSHQACEHSAPPQGTLAINFKDVSPTAIHKNLSALPSWGHIPDDRVGRSAHTKVTTTSHFSPLKVDPLLRWEASFLDASSMSSSLASDKSSLQIERSSSSMVMPTSSPPLGPVVGHVCVELQGVIEDCSRRRCLVYFSKRSPSALCYRHSILAVAIVDRENRCYCTAVA